MGEISSWTSTPVPMSRPLAHTPGRKAVQLLGAIWTWATRDSAHANGHRVRLHLKSSGYINARGDIAAIHREAWALTIVGSKEILWQLTARMESHRQAESLASRNRWKFTPFQGQEVPTEQHFLSHLGGLSHVSLGRLWPIIFTNLTINCNHCLWIDYVARPGSLWASPSEQAHIYISNIVSMSSLHKGFGYFSTWLPSNLLKELKCGKGMLETYWWMNLYLFYRFL